MNRDYDYDFNNDKKQLPYVGNGRLGLAISEDGLQPFYIKSSRALDLMFPFHPLINVDTTDSDHQRASAVEFEDGVAHRVTCLTVGAKQSYNVKEKIYAHRLIPSLFVQELQINNPSGQPLALRLKRNGWQGSQDVSVEPVVINSMIKYEYTLYSGLYAKYSSSEHLAFAVAAPIIPDFVEIKPRNTVNLVFYTFMNYTAVTGSNLSPTLDKLKQELKNVAIKTHSPMIKKAIYTNHRDAWNHLWRSGIGLSLSKAENVLNGDAINATIYYILSQKSYFAQDLDVFNPTTLSQLSRENKLIEEPASCYDGHSTFQANSLWSSLESVEQINSVVNLWLMTLDKQGCHNLIASGAEGTMQALILSMVPLQFTQHHVEFNTHPKDLHRDYYIRRLRFNANTFLNLTVKVSEQDNRASIYVAIDRKEDKDKELLACDAGCLDDPVKLNTLYTVFPVKLTEPLTPILYITADGQHIKELKHTIHVKEISLAPAHEDHVLMQHRHGHQLSSLAALFWLTVVFLIVLFHVYLARIIYHEYFANNSFSVPYEKVKNFVE